MNKDDFNILEMESVYTGGNIWNYKGKLVNGYFFCASDFTGDIFIVNDDPRQVEDCWNEDWLSLHKITLFVDETDEGEFQKIYKWLEVHENDS